MGKTVYTADMGQPPMDPEVAPPDKPASAPKGKQPADRSVFTQEDLKQFGGKMKSPPRDVMPEDLKKKPKKFAKGGMIDGIAQRGKTKCRMV